MLRFRRWRPVSPNLFIFLGYGLLTLLMTYPVVIHLTSRLVGKGGDPWIHYWNTWWVGQALSEATSPYHTHLIFYPRGASLVYHNFAWLNILASWALKPLMGLVAAYNVVFLLNIALCGYAMYDLAYYLVQHRPAAFVAGLVHAFWPYRLSHRDHPNLISSQWSVWFLLYLIRAVREGKRSHVLLCALFLSLTAFARLQLFILTLFVGGLYILYSLFAERDLWGWQTIKRLMIVGILTALAMAYPFFPLVQERAQDVFIDEQSQRQADLLAYAKPNAWHPVRQLINLDGLRVGYASFVGYVVSALACYGAVRAGRRSHLWLMIGVFSFVMALGPYLRVGGRVYDSLPLPYNLLGWFPAVRVLRDPHRFNVLLAIPVSVLTAYGVYDVAKRRVRLVPLVAFLILFEYALLPLPTLSLTYSPFYDQLAATPDQFGLYELPMGFSGAAKFHMFLQTIHAKPIAEGHISRPLGSVNQFIDGDPFTHRLRQSNEMSRELTDISRHLAYLADHDIRYLILHRDPELKKHSNYPTPERWAAWQDWLTVDPCYQDDLVAVYHTRTRYGRDFEFALDLGAPVGIIRAEALPPLARQGEVFWSEIRWGSRVAPGRDLTARLSLVDRTSLPRQSLDVQPCADWPTGDWLAGAVAVGRYGLQIDPHLPPGQYTVTVGLIGSGQTAPLGQLEILPLPRVFERPASITHPLDARFGDELRLLGYDLAQTDDDLTLTLHWQALGRIEDNFKVFVHLFGPERDEVVAQDDAVPRRWAYPMTWWQAGEVVSDPIPMPLAGVPPGRYRLAVGVYYPDTGERLPVLPDVTSTPDRELILSAEVVR